ncbi:MAG: methyltransferase domain-containing protein [Nanoarchaeota archaeon]|nr:methyltransferase domain-containing protein [Nanoarchaeota archaeon]
MARQILLDAIKACEGRTALDLGAGGGIDSLFMAESGFNVTAVDISSEHCNRIKAYNHPNIEVVCCDIRNYEFEGRFDLINCSFVLHYLKDDARGFLANIRENTAKSGLNIVKVLLGHGYYGHQTGFLLPGEIQQVYANWEILHYSEAFKPLRYKSSMTTGKQLAAFMLAKKS